MARLEIVPGRGDRWIVRDRERSFSVPAGLGRQLQGPDGVRLWRQLASRRMAEARPRPQRRGIWCRVTLLPARVVNRLAATLARASSWPAMAALGLVGLVGLATSLAGPGGGAVSWWLVLPFFLLTALIHELGHAAALHREGWPAGAVGAGLLWVVPVMWCDVSAVALVDRRGRARVDLAGAAYQLGAAGVLALVARQTESASALTAARGAAVAVVWSLLPLARTDGYWLVCDLLDLPDLEAPPRGPLTGSRRLTLVAWRVATALLLLSVAVLVPWRLQRWLGAQFGDQTTPAMILRAAAGVLLLIGGFRALGRVGRLLRAAWRDRIPGGDRDTTP